MKHICNIETKMLLLILFPCLKCLPINGLNQLTTAYPKFSAIPPPPERTAPTLQIHPVQPSGRRDGGASLGIVC